MSWLSQAPPLRWGVEAVSAGLSPGTPRLLRRLASAAGRRVPCPRLICAALALSLRQRARVRAAAPQSPYCGPSYSLFFLGGREPASHLVARRVSPIADRDALRTRTPKAAPPAMNSVTINKCSRKPERGGRESPRLLGLGQLVATESHRFVRPDLSRFIRKSE